MGLVIKTAATWVSDNTVLSDGDIGVESDTGHYKLGDGSTAWNSKAYYGLYSYSQLQLILLQNGVELQSAGSGSLFLAADGTYRAASGGVSDGDKGDITVSSGGTVWTIDNDAVTNSKISSVSATKVTEDSTHRFATDSEKSTWNAKQDALVSATNIKTINGSSILGSGDLTVSGSGLAQYQVRQLIRR